MKIDNEVLAVLSGAKVDGLFLTLQGQLDRKLYERANKVLEAAGGKWNRKAKAHVFATDASERIDQILLTGAVEVPKDEFNYFPTPPEVVDRLMNLAGVEHGMRVLEPSAGQGAIAHACAAAGADVDCFELMAANHAILDGDDRLGKVVFGDFMLAEPDAIYDRVVMNPPFMKQSDIKHVLHALKFLKPEGVLIAVMSAGANYRVNKLTKDFRDLVEQRGGVFYSLPEGSFKASGTGVNTVIAVIPAA